MVEFYIKFSFDDINYPIRLYLSDNENIIGSYRKPLKLNMIELENLSNIITPLINYYQKWKIKYNAFQSNKINKKDFLKITERLKTSIFDMSLLNMD